MKNIIKTSVFALSLTLFGCNWDQPQPPCAVGHGGYGASLTYVSGDTTGPCARNSEIIGVQKYRTPDSDAQTVHLRVEAITSTDWWNGTATRGDEYSTASGGLTENAPDADGFCHVPTLTTTEGPLMEFVSPDDFANEGPTLRYAFSNVDFFVEGATAGTQFRADLTITGVGATTCTATYKVNAMYPVIFCNDFAGDPDAPSDAACGEPDAVWSGYAASPLFATRCTGYGGVGVDFATYDYLEIGSPWQICVPATDVPSLE